MDLSTIGTTVAALYIIMIYTLVWKENILYRFAEHTLVATTFAVVTVSSVKYIIDISTTQITNGNIAWWLFMTVASVLLYAKFSKKIFWLYRWPTAILVGLGVGVTLRATVEAQILGQLKAMIITPGMSGMDIFNTIIGAVCTLMSFAYFLMYTFKGSRERVWNATVIRFGRYIIMATLGALFGGTVMARFALFISQMQYLLFDWLHL